jgi:ribose transport system permease protein
MTTEQVQVPPSEERPSGGAARLLEGVRSSGSYGVIVALVVVLVAASFIYSGFLSGDNIKNLLSQSTPDGLVAVGMTVLLLTGHFDLSAGPALALCAVVYADAANHTSLVVAALIALAVGAIAGMINGLIVTKLKVNPFVATLGTGSIYAGAAFLYSKQEPIAVDKEGFQTLGNGQWLGVPICVVVLAVIAAIMGFILVKTRFGRSVYAVGGNSEASRLCGIRVDTVRLAAYMIVGLCAAGGGMIVASSLGVVQASVGADTSLNAIAIVIVGGTSLLGGEGAMWRTVCGLLILATIQNVLDANAVNSSWQAVITGLVIVGAVAADSASGALQRVRERRVVA